MLTAPSRFRKSVFPALVHTSTSGTGVHGVSTGETPRMTRFGPCRYQYCTCRSFKFTNDAQFCDNCGHSRSLHQS